MERMSLRLAVVAAAALAWGCKGPAPEAAKSKFTLEQLKARFYMDLGPNTVDVASYPKNVQDGYQVFANACSQCHTLARPINASEVSREDWDKHVRRMHEKTLAYGWWTKFGKDDAKKILDFLAYDSKVRKVDGKAAFEKRTEELKALLAEVEAERARLQLDEGRREARPEPPYTGAKP